MIGRIFFAAILAGIAAGFVMSAVQMWRVVPLIMHAEAYEEGHGHAEVQGGADEHGHAHDVEGTHGHSHESGAGHGHSHEHEEAGQSHDDDHGHAHDGWMPEDGIERTTFTILANVVTGVGFALVLMAAVVFSGRPITAANGAIWGMIGFFVFAVAPALGLPPELPGMGGGEIPPRQVWWIATAVATAGGIAALVLWPGALAKVGGIALIALPHLVGAPVEHALDSPVPAELAAQFVAASLASAAVFWAVLGVLMGWLVEREPATAEARA